MWGRLGVGSLGGLPFGKREIDQMNSVMAIGYQVKKSSGQLSCKSKAQRLV